MRCQQKLVGITLTFLSISVLSHAAEKKISKSALPHAVAKTADEQSSGATVRGFSRDMENGQMEYEVEMIVNGHSKDVTIANDGHVMEVEEQVEMNALPATVQHGLKAKVAQGKITRIESITKHGTIVAYEAQVLTAEMHKEIQVGPDGQTLDHEE
jgi:hypothetical protein